MVYGFVLYTFEIKILRDLLKDNHKKFRVHESIALTYQQKNQSPAFQFEK